MNKFTPNVKFDEEFDRQWNLLHPPQRKFGHWEYVPITAEEIQKHGGAKEMWILAKIGQSGTHVHKVRLRYFQTTRGIVALNAYSYCGSVRWSNRGGSSPIYPLESDNLDLVNCDKCRGIRVKGGKAPEPATKRPRIDPESRPKKYRFNYLFDYASHPGGGPGNKNCTRDIDVKAMTLAEAKVSVVKRINSSEKYYLSEGGKWHDLVLASVWYWNDAPYWRKSLGTPYPGK